MLRKLMALVLLAAVAAVAAVFAVQNPGSMSVDVGVAVLNDVRVSVAFAVTFALGWLFGLACCLMPLLRLLRQRRRVERELREARTEVSSLRRLPLRDAH